MALTGVTKKLIKLIHTAVNNTAYIYKCSNKLNTHEDTMSMLKNKVHCTNIYSGTYDDEFILSCDNKIDFNPPAAAITIIFIIFSVLHIYYILNDLHHELMY